jgi:hypothetical protein
MQAERHLTVKQSMSLRPDQGTQGWRVWVVQVALLCLLCLHSIGLLHKHATAAEHDACVACQIVDQQALDVPDAAGVLLALWLLLFLVAPWHRGVVLAAELFRRPPSRAPPFFLAS